MSYEENIVGFDPGFNGSREFPVNNLGPIQFSQIFNGTPQLYAGSSFTIEEVIEFGVLINKPEVIDVDFRWYPPKKYLGTWTIFDQVSVFGTYPEDRGFIEDFTTKIRRYSTYVVQANADVPIAVHEQSAIDDCNFNLVSVQVGVPPVQVEGSGLFEKIAVLKSRDTLTRVPLLDQPFNARIKTIGLYIDAGSELTFINYKCRVINAISVDLPAFPITNCQVEAVSCDGLFAQYLASINNNTSVVQFYATEPDALAAQTQDGNTGSSSLTVQQTSPFVCTAPPGTVYEVWQYQRTLPT